MKRIIIVIAIIGSFLISGCFESQEEYSRYPSVGIPEYSMEDYHNLLLNKNPEIVYNAVCNLLGMAKQIGVTLSDAKMDKKSKEYTVSLNIYKKILQLLTVRNDKIVASSLRFLQLFSQAENIEKKELIEPISNIRTKSSNVEFEQLIALSGIVSRGSLVDKAFIEKFLRNKSWLVSRAAYLLVNKLEDDQIRAELINKYRLLDDEMEKLLILGSLRNGFSDNVFEFLSNEILYNNNIKIRRYILMMLGNGQDQNKVLSWIQRNYEMLSKEDINILTNTCYNNLGDTFSSSLFIVFLRNGFKPEGDYLKKLNDSIISYENKLELSSVEKTALNNLLRIEQALLESNSTKGVWLSLKSATKDEQKINSEIKDLYNKSIDQFIPKAERVLKKHNLDDKKREEYLTGLRELKDVK